MRDMLVRVLDSSDVKIESHEHIPSEWSPDGQEVFRELLASRPNRSLSHICQR